MANTSSRTLRLLSLLQNHRYWPGGELARRLGVSPRTLRRDIDRLRELGYPVRAQRGADGGYQLAAGAAVPPLVLDDDEAVALAVALRAAAATGAPGVSADDGAEADTVAEASVRALAKLAQVMPGRLRRQVEALTAMTVPTTWWRSVPSVPTGVLTTLALACRDAERVRFGYTAADGARTDRYAEPHRLVSLAGRWYLVGYDLGRLDWRTFRVDRIGGPPLGTGERFRPRTLPAADAAAYVRQGIGSARSGYDIEVLMDAPAGRVRSAIGRWSSVEAVGPERCRVRMTADSLDWAMLALGMAGADFRVLSPPELAGRVRDWARRFTAASGPDAGTMAL